MADGVRNLCMSRRAIRLAVFRLLFICDSCSGVGMEAQKEIFFDGAGGEDLAEDFSPGVEDVSFVFDKYEKIDALLPEIDELLNRTSKGWKTSRMNKVDLNVLRLAAYEILYDDDVPTGVAINEAVELAKKYGGDDSGAFVNGILGMIARDADK